MDIFYNSPETKNSQKDTKKGASVIWILLVLLIGFTGFVIFLYHTEPRVKVGDTVTVNGSFIATARNLDPIKIADDEIRYGTDCMIEEGGTITVLGMSEGYILAEYSHVPGKVVEYRSTRPYSFFGSCPNHTPFFITKNRLSEMKKAEEQKLDKIAEEKEEMAIVKKILNGKKHG